MTRKQLVKILADAGVEDEVMLVDDFEDAFLGLTDPQPGRVVCAVYDTEAIVRLLMKRDKMSYSQAFEFFEYNVAGAYMGERTPIFVTRIITPTKKKGTK